MRLTPLLCCGICAGPQTYPPPAGRLALGLSSGFMAGAPATPAVQALGRKLYRFMRR
jgi:hypothetical protein